MILLSDREFRTMRALSEGKTTLEVADMFGWRRVATVHQYMSRAKKRLGARTMFQAVSMVGKMEPRA